MSIELLDQNHRDAIVDAFHKAKRSIRIISPFVQESMTQYLVGASKNGIKGQLITRFYREDFVKSVSSLNALSKLVNSGISIYALEDLHTKLYLFDDNVAIVGSANFTGGGFGKNIELSLLIEDEYDIIEKLSNYYEEIINAIKKEGNYLLDITKIEDEKLIVQKVIKGRDSTSKPNPTRFGAKIKNSSYDDVTIPDTVEDILSISEESIAAVLKFEGAAHRRIDPKTKYEPNFSSEKGVYFTASPRSPRSITDDTTIFLSAVSRDKAGAGVPIIVGKAKTNGYNSKNITDSSFGKDWIIDYPYYIELYEIEIIDSEIENGISLSDLIAEVGYKLYPNTENEPSTSIPSLRTRHHQKAYIAITPYAASRINNLLEGLFEKYGKRIYNP